MPRDPSDVLLSKAREDARLASLLVDNASVSDEHVGFFCQQAIEKALKSELSRRGIAYRRKHDLAELLDLLRDHGVAFPTELEAAVALTPFAAAMRYDYLPDDAEEEFDRDAAVKLTEQTLEWVATRSAPATGAPDGHAAPPTTDA